VNIEFKQNKPDNTKRPPLLCCNGGLFIKLGANDEARTRYLHLGKVALYQMSYVRIGGA
jgi:hypothetical protein